MALIAAADHHEIADVEEPALSPAGDEVAFVVKRPSSDTEYEATVHVADVEGGDVSRFTAREGVDSEPRWSPDGDRLAFVSTRGEDDRQQLWVVPREGGEARQVTNVAGGVSSIRWSPDGSAVAFVQRCDPEQRETGADRDLDAADYEDEEPDPRVVDRMFYRIEDEYFDGSHPHVYVAELETDSVEAVTTGGYDHFAPAWGDASTLYYGVKREGNPDDNITYDIVASDRDAGDAETVTRTSSWPNFELAATSDGRIAYPTTDEEQASLRTKDVEVYDRTDGTSVTVSEGLDRTFGRSSPLFWGPDEENLYFLCPDEGSFVVYRAPADGAAEPEAVVDDAHVSAFSVGPGGVAFVQSEWDHPGDLFFRPLDGSGSRRLTEVNDAFLADREVREPEEFWFEGDGGTEIQAWVLTPPGFDPGRTYPAVVEVHGGPHAMWSASGTMWHEFQTLAARGYVVFWCNPRGSSGYGEAFKGGVERDWGGVIYRDLMAGVDELAGREYVDEGNLFVTGGSFGGYMTNWMVGQSDRFEAAVGQRSVSDLTSCYGSSRVYRLMEWDMNSLPWEEPELWWESSPISSAASIDTPLLLLHSEGDFNVPICNAELLFHALKKLDVDTRLVRYPREGHELSRSGEPGHVVDRLERIARWFDGYSDHHDVGPVLEEGDDWPAVAGDDRE